jgi:hypothetical protein
LTHVFVEESGRQVEPFGGPVLDTPIGNRSLREWLDEAISGAGLTRIDAFRPPCLVIPDNLFCTAGALRQFIEGASGRDAVLVLKRSRFGSFVTPVQPDVVETDSGWRFPTIRYLSGQEMSPVDVVVDPEEQELNFDVRNPYMGTDRFELGLARHPLMTIHHWVHILWANQVYGSIEVRNTPSWKFVCRLLWAAFRAMSINRWKVLGKLNRIGRGCDIHPTALIEGSTLADGVSVGPYARVMLSNLGEGVDVMAGAQVELSTVGAGAVVSEQTVLRFSVLYPEAVASQNLMQQCVLGRRAVTTAGAFSMDLNFDQSIRVPLDGKLYDTGQQFLGSAFGHGCRVGTGFWLASGRMIPNDYFVIRSPEQVLSRIPENLAEQNPLAIHGQTLVPLGSEITGETRD